MPTWKHFNVQYGSTWPKHRTSCSFMTLYLHIPQEVLYVLLKWVLCCGVNTQWTYRFSRMSADMFTALWASGSFARKEQNIPEVIVKSEAQPKPFAPPEVSYVTTSGQLASGHPGYLQVSSQSWERLDPARSWALPPTVRLRHICSKYRQAVKKCPGDQKSASTWTAWAQRRNRHTVTPLSCSVSVPDTICLLLSFG